MRCYIFDLDGTISDLTHRLHHIKPEFDSQGNLPAKDWRAFFAACGDDAPVPHIIELAKDVFGSGASIVYVSGRSDECRGATRTWMDTHGLPPGRLYMRKEGDHRGDHIIKAELLTELLAEGYRPVMAFDDRNRVVQAWRKNGVPCAQVADGDF